MSFALAFAIFALVVAALSTSLQITFALRSLRKSRREHEARMEQLRIEHEARMRNYREEFKR